MTEPNPPATPGPAGEEPPRPDGAGSTAAGPRPIEGVALAPDPEPPGTQPPVAGAHPTAPVTPRPAVRPRRRGPMTRMGPWAPVAGLLLGLVLGVVAAVFLAGSA